MAEVIEGEAAVNAARRSGLVQPNLAPPSRPVSYAPPQTTSTASGYNNQTSAPLPQSTSTASGYNNQTGPSAPAPEPPRSPGLSKSGSTALIVLFVIALLAGLLVWGVAFGGSKKSDQNSGASCNNSSEASNCKPSPSSQHPCKCNGGKSSDTNQSSDNNKCCRPGNDTGKSHQC